jgi:hypothetical protein
MSQIESYNLYALQQFLTATTGHTAVLLDGDSISSYRQRRIVGAMRLGWGLPQKAIALEITAGQFTAESGFQGVNTNPTGATTIQLDPGDTGAAGLGSGSLLTGLESTTYNYPVRGLRIRFPTEPATGLQAGRLFVSRLTHDTSLMLEGNGSGGASYPLGDPTTGEDCVFRFGRLGNVNGADWSQHLLTDVDLVGTAASYNGSQTHGYAVDATIPGDQLALVVSERTVEQPVGPGTGWRIRLTATDDGARVGTESLLVGAAVEITSRTTGVSYWTIAQGGWRTIDTLGPTINGEANDQAKYTDAALIDYLTKIVKADRYVVRIQIGENIVGSGPFAEGSGSDLGAYDTSLSAKLDRWRSIFAIMGKDYIFELVGSQNTVVGGARMLSMAEANRALAEQVSDAAFWDLRGRLIDLGLVDANLILESQYTDAGDGVHPSQSLIGIIGPEEWSAIASATAPPVQSLGVSIGTLSTPFPRERSL